MNALVDEFKGRLEAIKAWRHHLHKHPELSLEEVDTEKYIAGLVKSWGYEVVDSVGKHGVVASMTAGTGTNSIGLRADTDALPIQEDNDLPYKSEVAGVSHLCGHDGHSAMLLAAGEYLARTRNFNGTVRLIFSACRRDHGRRPRDDRGWPLRALARRRGVWHAQHAGPRARQAAFSRRRDDGSRRQLGD
jgi:hippurate hydrolase